ncbi:MAG: glycosyltransferase family 4 protein [Methylomicrobium sp.]|nr:glycosyltransferase family 4 protein [Methylomicrobium sp.]
MKDIKLVIGTTSLVHPLTGIGQYTLNLAQALSQKPGLDITFFNGYRWSKTAEVRHIPQSGLIRKWVKRILPRPYETRIIVQQRLFDSGYRNLRPVIYHEPNFLPLNFDRETVITVHDLSYLRFPEAHPVERVRIMEKLLPPAIEKASCIIADSNFTKKEILELFGVESGKVHVTQLGKSADFYPRSAPVTQPVLDKYGLIPDRYLLAVGTLEPRKNLIQAIQAYRSLPEQVSRHFPLAIVGMRGWKEKGLLTELDVLLKEKKAFLLGYVTAEDLPFLYSGARGFVFPSLYEGFGLPVLEAMASGVPVIATNSSSLPEVVGQAGLSVEVGDVEALAEKIAMICEDDHEYSRLSNAGLKQANNFSWDKCADQTIAAYNYALGDKK